MHCPERLERTIALIRAHRVRQPTAFPQALCLLLLALLAARLGLIFRMFAGRFLGPTARLDAKKIARFGTLMRHNITQGDIPFRKAYLRSLIEAVEVDDRVIRIHVGKLNPDVGHEIDPRKNGFSKEFESLGRAIYVKDLAIPAV